MMNLNEFAQEVHANAIAHGWWDEEYTDAAVIALIHSEISEAFEEWRAGRPMVWHQCEVHDQRRPCEKEKCRLWFNGKCLEGRDGRKPEGIAVELIDVVLRVLDLIAGHGLEFVENDVDSFARLGHLSGIDALALPDLIVRLHYGATMTISFMEQGADYRSNCSDCLNALLASVFAWIRAQDLSPEALLLEKHEYNKTRPYRHGGKRV